MSKIAYNKGVYGEKRRRYMLGLDVECVHHGMHKEWVFSEKHRQLSCRFCLNQSSKKFRQENPFSVFLTWAKRRNKEVNIDSQYLKDLFENQKELCALSEIKLDRSNMSLDRINSSIGYIKGNLQWVHKDINRMKTNLSEDEFVNLCKQVAISAAKKKK